MEKKLILGFLVGLVCISIGVVLAEELEFLEIKELGVVEKGLNISYAFDNKEVVGDRVSIEIWVEDSNNSEIERIYDVFSINRDDLIERNVFIEIPEDLVGIGYVYFALSDDLDNFVKRSIVFGDVSITGDVVIENPKSKLGIYIVFLLIIGVVVFFIVRKHDKGMYGEKHSWFLGREKPEKKK